MSDYPMRINKYLALKQLATRRGADELIAEGVVYVNGKRAELGQKVAESDKVEVRAPQKEYRYYAYNKPRHIITHSPQGGEVEIASVAGLEGVFPIGRLDKDSHGLIILTNDGRVTDRLLNPDYDHEKEYRVTTVQKLRPSFAENMEKGVNISGYVTKKCKVNIMGENMFSIVLSEGKKHQIRRMCSEMHVDIADLARVRIMRVRLGGLKAGEYRELAGNELAHFLSDLNLDAPPQK